MMATGIVTSVQECIDYRVVGLAQHDGFHSIGALSEELGVQCLGPDAASASTRAGSTASSCRSTRPRRRRRPARRCRGRPASRTFRSALGEAASLSGPVVVHVQTDSLMHAPDSESWWDVPVSQVAELDSTRQANETGLANKARQRDLP